MQVFVRDDADPECRDEGGGLASRSERRPTMMPSHRAIDFSSGPIVRVETRTNVRDAHRVALERGATYVLVFEADALVGVVCTCALESAAPTVPVSERMQSPAHSMLGTTPIADAATVMRDRSLSCLPLLGDAGVVGVLTRDDLRRAGLPDEAFNRRRCAACGSCEHVRSDEVRQLRWCDDCRNLLRPPRSSDDLGGGD